MPTLDDVYRKFGEAAEAAQLLETDLGTMLLFFGVVDEGLISPALEVDSKGAADLLRRINRQTLGQLLRNSKPVAPSVNYGTFRSEIRKAVPKYKHALAFDISAYFNSIYHHDLAE
jgi:hypothetical protein